MRENKMDVFIIGAKGIPARYGGYETFVEQLVKRPSPGIQYHVTCMSDRPGRFDLFGAVCHNIPVHPRLPASVRAVLYNLKAYAFVCSLIKKNALRNGFLYQLSCRLGPFVFLFKGSYRRAGFQLAVNTDGLEWNRKKWNRLIRLYWKLCEISMVRAAEWVICDSRAIQRYILGRYQHFHPKTQCIAYGAQIGGQAGGEARTKQWLKKNGLSQGKYYLTVGRFEPENNIELIVREYLRSSTPFPLVLISNLQKNGYYRRITRLPGFFQNRKLLLSGPIYDQPLLSGIRKNAFAYIHGHEVGGTNPSLLEALATTPLSLVLDVEFNRETAGPAGLYFSTREGSLSRTFRAAESLSAAAYRRFSRASVARIKKAYTWPKIAEAYVDFFNSNRRHKG